MRGGWEPGGWGGEWGRRTPRNVLCTQLTTPTWNNGSFSEQHRQTQRHRPLLYVKQCVFHQPVQQVKEAPAGRGLTGGWQSRALTRLILHSAFVSTSVSTCVCVYVHIWFVKHQRLEPIKDTPLCVCVWVCLHSPWVNIWNSEDSPSALEWIRERRDCPWRLCTSQGLGVGWAVVGCFYAWVCMGVLQQRPVCMQIHFTCSLCLCSTHPLNNPTVLFGQRIYWPWVMAVGLV